MKNHATGLELDIRQLGGGPETNIAATPLAPTNKLQEAIIYPTKPLSSTPPSDIALQKKYEPNRSKPLFS
jgi:hypothetical protein